MGWSRIAQMLVAIEPWLATLGRKGCRMSVPGEDLDELWQVLSGEPWEEVCGEPGPGRHVKEMEIEYSGHPILLVAAESEEDVRIMSYSSRRT